MDKSAEVSRCVGCGGLFPAIDGPRHRYMESSPGCWQAYGEVLAREYSDEAFRSAHHFTVDAYAVQHPGSPSPQSIRSVGVHLISLHLLLERGLSSDDAARALQVALKASKHYVWLTPPVSMGPITVADVRIAPEPSEHKKIVREWAEASWAAWRAHHDTIRRWTHESRT